MTNRMSRTTLSYLCNCIRNDISIRNREPRPARSVLLVSRTMTGTRQDDLVAIAGNDQQQPGFDDTPWRMMWTYLNTRWRWKMMAASTIWIRLKKLNHPLYAGSWPNWPTTNKSITTFKCLRIKLSCITLFERLIKILIATCDFFLIFFILFCISKLTIITEKHQVSPHFLLILRLVFSYLICS